MAIVLAVPSSGSNAGRSSEPMAGSGGRKRAHMFPRERRRRGVAKGVPDVEASGYERSQSSTSIAESGYCLPNPIAAGWAFVCHGQPPCFSCGENSCRGRVERYET